LLRHSTWNLAHSQAGKRDYQCHQDDKKRASERPRLDHEASVGLDNDSIQQTDKAAELWLLR
jgi:hypothetical protein